MKMLKNEILIEFSLNPSPTKIIIEKETAKILLDDGLRCTLIKMRYFN
jgi:hypothetical protein